MAVVNAAQALTKTVADPNAAYESLKAIWEKSRAVCNGERFVKDYDAIIDPASFTNLLIPFSPSMTPQQYNFYKAEAELPGITAQFSKMIIGGLLRKPPQLTLPDDIEEGAIDWIANEFGKDDSTLVAFLDMALWEEIQTSRAWVFVDYPAIRNVDDLTPEERDTVKPYPILHKAESIVNWRVREDVLGKNVLDRIIVRGYRESFDDNEFHPTYRDTVWVHELDENGLYRVRVFERNTEASTVVVVAGQQQAPADITKAGFDEVELIEDILINDERLTFIPAWPLNGNIDAMQPMLTPIIDKEVSLYNKISRRNHLLYGASTYTPVITGDMTDERAQAIVDAGLGSWLFLPTGATATVLETPTAALADMEVAISAGIEEMAKLGIRMLTPESDQSGVALEIRNASQTAQLGSLNNKVSHTMKQVIAFMLNWRYNLELTAAQIDFSLSTDFQPLPLGEAWLRLATEWYDAGKIPRSIWLNLLKHNDIVAPDYNDEEGQAEIEVDLEKTMNRQNDAYAAKLELDTAAQQNAAPVQ